MSPGTKLVDKESIVMSVEICYSALGRPIDMVDFALGEELSVSTCACVSSLLSSAILL